MRTIPGVTPSSLAQPTGPRDWGAKQRNHADYRDDAHRHDSGDQPDSDRDKDASHQHFKDRGADPILKSLA